MNKRKNILFSEKLEPKEDIGGRFKDCRFYVPWYASEEPNLESEMLDIRVIDNNKIEYTSNFTTLNFLKWVFEKNKRSGECADGTYFCMSRTVIVESLSQENIKRTIEELIDNYEFNDYFTKSKPQK